MKRLVLYLLISLNIAGTCNRDHLKIERNNLPQGYADSQVVGTWKITAISSNVSYDWNGDGAAETDIFNTWSTCQKDNLYTFTADTINSITAEKRGTFQLNCSVTKPGRWLIVNTQDLVYVPEGQLPESEKFISMTSVQFKTTQDFSLPTGQPVKITKTWTRQ